MTTDVYVSNDFLGNTNTHRITSHGRYEMKIGVEHDDGYTYYGLYKDFYVASEQDYFRLTFGKYSGNYGKLTITTSNGICTVVIGQNEKMHTAELGTF